MSIYVVWLPNSKPFQKNGFFVSFAAREYHIRANPKFECEFKIAESWRAKIPEIENSKRSFCFEISPFRPIANIILHYAQYTEHWTATHHGYLCAVYLMVYKQYVHGISLAKRWLYNNDLCVLFLSIQLLARMKTVFKNLNRFNGEWSTLCTHTHFYIL